MTELLLARYAPKNLEPVNSIGAKWERMLEALDLGATVQSRSVCVKMHLGGGTGYTTIHPFFTRILVRKLREAGAKLVFVADSPGAVRSAAERGYTAETVGCPIVSISGMFDTFVYTRPVHPPLGVFDSVEIGGEVLDAEVLVDFSHVKGHGACGFGGASKNLSMGCVNQKTRGRIHALEFDDMVYEATFPLPEALRGSRMEASLRNGVLTVRFTPRPRSGRRSIPVNQD